MNHAGKSFIGNDGLAKPHAIADLNHDRRLEALEIVAQQANLAHLRSKLDILNRGPSNRQFQAATNRYDFYMLGNQRSPHVKLHSCLILREFDKPISTSAMPVLGKKLLLVRCQTLILG